MRTKKLIQPLFGTDRMVVEDLILDSDTQIITVIARIPKKDINRCPHCNKKCKRYDRGRGVRRWRGLDLGTFKLYVEAEVWRITCPEHGVITCSVPWARHGSAFCRNFEDTAAWLACEASQSMVSQFMRVDWHSVGHICRRVYEDLEANLEVSRFDQLVNIGIDETSYKKGHKYMTVVVNHDNNAVIWCKKGYGKDTLKQFFESLTDEQKASIRCVTADGAKYIRDCIEEYCPNAERCVDTFHVVQWATDTLDELRRQYYRDVSKVIKSLPKRGRGRPKKGEELPQEVIEAKAIKGSRYSLLKNPEDLTENQMEQIDFIVSTHPRLFRAYGLKEGLRLALKAGKDDIEDCLKWWMNWAQRSQIPEFVELRAKIKNHYDAIIATAKHGLSNARIESTNNRIKLIIRRAYGFRNIDNLLAMVMLNCSETRPTLPGRKPIEKKAA